MRNKASAFYQECVCTVANDTLSFGNGLSLSLGDVLQVEADLLQFELKLSTAQGTVRVRTLSAQAMQMWMRVLPPSTYRNEHRKYAIPRNAECQEITVARRPAAPVHHALSARRGEACEPPSPPSLSPSPPPSPPRSTVALLSLGVGAGGRVGASLRARDLSRATNLDTGDELTPRDLASAYAAAPREAFAFCLRGDNEVLLAELANTVRNLDTGEAVPARALEQVYLGAPGGTAFDWAARSRSGGVSETAPPAAFPSTCRVRPT